MPTGAKFRPQRTGDPNVDRLAADVAAVLDQLEGARRGNLESQAQLSTQATLQLGEGLVFRYIGDGVGTWTLPRATVRGIGRTLVLHIANDTTFALSVLAAGSETIDGALSTLVGPGTTAVLASDGADNWSRAA